MQRPKLKLISSFPLRVQAICNCLQGNPSEPVSFTTLSCEPDPPNPPRKASGTKNSLVLQWKVNTYLFYFFIFFFFKQDFIAFTLVP